MSVPQLNDNSRRLADEINSQLSKTEDKHYEVLTRSQAKMADLEKETRELENEKAEVDSAINRNEENARRLVRLVEHDKQISRDLDVSIQSNLEAIHSLRERGVKLPATEKRDG